MNDLIAELEAATEGSRELDDEIFLAIHPDQGTFSEDGEYWYAMDLDEDGGPWALLPNYTTSLEAALTLVSSGAHVSAQFDTPEKGCDTAASIVLSYGEKRLGGGGHYTPALAVCIAALKARPSAAAEVGDGSDSAPLGKEP